MRRASQLSRKASLRSFVTFLKSTGSMWPVCETVNGHQDIKLSYMNTPDDPLTKALSVQK